MIKRIELKNIRPFSFLNLNIQNEKVIFIGPNGIGKTTILEAILLSTITKSPKTNYVNEIIKNENDYGMIKIYDDSNELKIVLSNNGKSLFYNQKEFSKISDYLGIKKVVYFIPSEIEIINGSPNVRRNFLNLNISQINKIYLKNLNQYNNLLKERNLLLKDEQPNLNYLRVLNDQMVELNKSITKERIKLIEEINNKINKIHQYLSKNETIKIIYKSSFKTDNYLNELEESLIYDLKTKNTNLGIHRDDFIIYLNNEEASKYASVGQIKSIILSIKITLCLIYKDYFNEYPLFLLDDVFGELDDKRINNLLKVLNRLNQVFITSVDINNVDQEKIKNFQIIKLGA